ELADVGVVVGGGVGLVLAEAVEDGAVAGGAVELAGGGIDGDAEGEGAGDAGTAAGGGEKIGMGGDGLFAGDAVGLLFLLAAAGDVEVVDLEEDDAGAEALVVAPAVGGGFPAGAKEGVRVAGEADGGQVGEQRGG